MSEHQKQTEFFKTMVRGEESQEHRQLREQILTAERNERCVRRAIIKIAMLMAISFLGAMYTAVIMPEVIFEANHVLRKVFYVLALGSIMTVLTYIGFWFYYRALLFQVHTECRHFIMALADKNLGVLQSSDEREEEIEMVLTERTA